LVKLEPMAQITSGRSGASPFSSFSTVRAMQAPSVGRGGAWYSAAPFGGRGGASAPAATENGAATAKAVNAATRFGLMQDTPIGLWVGWSSGVFDARGFAGSIVRPRRLLVKARDDAA
jgi:hypothetical protein